MMTNRLASKNPSLGIDVGGTKIKAIALKAPCEILEEVVLPSCASDGPDAVRAAIVETIRHFEQKNIPFETIGIGCAGSVDFRNGVVRNSPNFANWKNVPLRDWIAKDSGRPCIVENDANCAVVAEWKEGAGRGLQNIVLLTLGTGVGGGVVIENRLFRGATGTAGELGHFSIDAKGIPCPCGNVGCFERYCSATAVKTKAGGLNSKEIFSRTSSPECKAIVAEFLYYFKVGLVSLANMFDPEIFLLGGAVSESVANYRPELLEWLRAHAFPAVGAQIRIEKTRFGNLSGAIGAAILSKDS